MRLTGLEENGGEISASRLQRVIDALLRTAEAATRLLVTGRGAGTGTKPSWLRASVDFMITGIESGSTVLEIEAPFLGDTAHDQISQQDLWYEKPNFNETALDLAILAIRDTESSEAAGNRFDSAVLQSVLKFKLATSSSDVRCELSSQDHEHGTVVLDTQLYSRLEERLRNIPVPRAFVVSGKLDEIKYQKGRFRILISNGTNILGNLHPDALDIEVLRYKWGKMVTVDGMVYFKSDGNPRYIEARRISDYVEGDRLFEKLPKAKDGESRGFDPSFYRHIRSSDPLDIIGQWPGDESIEEILAELD